MKKVVFIVLVLVLMLAIAVPAFAAVTETGDTVTCGFPPEGIGQSNRTVILTFPTDGILNAANNPNAPIVCSD